MMMPSKDTGLMALVALCLAASVRAWPVPAVPEETDHIEGSPAEGSESAPHSARLSLSVVPQEGAPPESRIDPPIVNMPVACLRTTMKGRVLERYECPKGQTCTKGPIEIIKFDKEMKVWHCQKDEDADKKMGKSEKMQGDGPKSTTQGPDIHSTTSVFVEPANLPTWYNDACLVTREDGLVIKRGACASHEECSSKPNSFWLFKQEVEVHHCQKKKPTLPPALQGLPDWLICHLIRSGRFSINRDGSIGSPRHDGYIPVANC